MKPKVIVTGATGVIGKVVVKKLAENYEVISVARSLGNDLSDENFVKDWFSTHNADYLINLFAMNDHISGENGKRETLFDISLDTFRNYMEVNLTSLFSVCREFARNNNNSGIVNFSSIYGIVSPQPKMYDGGEKHIGYSVSKAGVIQLSKHLAVHLAPDIRVNCVVPGGVYDSQGGTFLKNYKDHVPIGRMMKAEELIGILEYLCSDKSSYTSGSTFVIDGGWIAV